MPDNPAIELIRHQRLILMELETQFRELKHAMERSLHLQNLTKETIDVMIDAAVDGGYISRAEVLRQTKPVIVRVDTRDLPDD